MDILRKELEEIYGRQGLDEAALDVAEVERSVAETRILARLSGMCAVVTDIGADRSYFLPGAFANALQLEPEEREERILSSSDEDFLYSRMHPADLAELRMLELAFFTMVDALPQADKADFRATATVRMLAGDGGEVAVEKSTQALRLAPNGGLWLVLCTYGAPTTVPTGGTAPTIVNLRTGAVQPPAHTLSRDSILTEREKQVLRLIRRGCLSKEIAARMGISVNTVSRHRQNILVKLSVDNSMEAVNAALAMRLL